MARVIPLSAAQPRTPKPEWLKVRAPGSPSYLRLKGLMRELDLHTVCEEARCPNIGECWNHGTATFMILGDVCTRACSYCAVAHGRPGAVDLAEPARVANAIHTLGLNYVVITSVDRDDLEDGGASIFAETIRETRARRPHCRIEVLIPDFQGQEAALRAVLDARPDVLNHNTETVPRLYRMARSGGRYERTLQLLDRSRRFAPDIPTKTGLMVGLGEEHDELVATFKDLRAGRLRDSDDRSVPPAHRGARADGALLPSGRIPRPETGGARSRVRARGVRPAGPQLVPRARNGGRLRARRARLTERLAMRLWMARSRCVACDRARRVARRRESAPRRV